MTALFLIPPILAIWTFGALVGLWMAERDMPKRDPKTGRFTKRVS